MRKSKIVFPVTQVISSLSVAFGECQSQKHYLSLVGKPRMSERFSCGSRIQSTILEGSVPQCLDAHSRQLMRWKLAVFWLPVLSHLKQGSRRKFFFNHPYSYRYKMLQNLKYLYHKKIFIKWHTRRNIKVLEYQGALPVRYI